MQREATGKSPLCRWYTAKLSYLRLAPFHTTKALKHLFAVQRCLKELELMLLLLLLMFLLSHSIICQNNQVFEDCEHPFSIRAASFNSVPTFAAIKNNSQQNNKQPVCVHLRQLFYQSTHLR